MEAILDLINVIPGGIAEFCIEEGRFVPTFFSDGVPALSGHSRGEFEKMVSEDALNIIYAGDRARVAQAAGDALENGRVLDISFRMCHKDGHIIWIHVNGQRKGALSGKKEFCAYFTGMSEETKLFESIAGETADGIYVIDKENYELLYVNESKKMFQTDMERVGKKCYYGLHGKQKPCEHCTLKTHAADGKAHEMPVEGTDRFYSTRFMEADWNGIPAYVKFVHDVTEEVRVQKEKDRLEQYFQTLIRHLPGGIAVVDYQKDGIMVPEFMSDGFAAMTGMPLEEAWGLYRKDAMAGVHPDDRELVKNLMKEFISRGEKKCEMVYRLQKGDGGYVWVKNSLTMIQSGAGEGRIYVVYHDVTKEREEQALLRQQYHELLRQHYRTSGPDVLIVGHCNIMRNKILEILDHTDSDLLKTFGTVREEFFNGIAGLVVDAQEREAFRNTYLNAPTLEAFRKGINELEMRCFIKLPKEKRGRYVLFQVDLVEAPDTGEVTGILTVKDVTQQAISDRILHQLSFTSYDLVVDADLFDDRYTVLSGDISPEGSRMSQGSHKEHVKYLLKHQVVPRDRQMVEEFLDPEYMLKRLEKEGSYSFSYSITGGPGEVLTKNITISAADLRLGRICLARADITDSVREQRNMLNVVAYTFELMEFIDVITGGLVMYTREIVLRNLPPLKSEHYEGPWERAGEYYDPQGGREEVDRLFCLDRMVEQLGKNPSGYDFVLPYYTQNGLRYKQINVLWGNEDHKTVCVVQADVTDMLAAEHRAQNALEKALELAEEANRAKSDFLSSMSHDIRTPMNAIMGMTALANAHIDDKDRVKECLRKISLSSRHLLSLINDILDMSKIERSRITLNRMKISMADLMRQLSDMLEPQAVEAGLVFESSASQTEHVWFYGDSLRINQILINLLSNAIKFTPEGGRVEFTVQEIPSHADAGYVRLQFAVKDTGVGMTKEFLTHIFDPFTRSSSSSGIEGTGLGLSITKGLVDLMGGEISVRSEPLIGTEFRVELELEIAGKDDRTDTQNETGMQFLPEEKPLAGRYFLVAEDNEINSEILCELLQMYGADTVATKDGIQAVRAFSSSAPGTYDAVLMDIRMPEMNGYDATRSIRSLKRTDAGSIPVIAMTANAFAEDIQTAADAGMTAHVAKPIDIHLLIATLGRLMRPRAANP